MRYKPVESLSVQQQVSPQSSLLSDMTVDARLNAFEPRLSWFYIRLLLLTGISRAIQAAGLVLLDFSRVLVEHDIGMGILVLELLGISLFVGSMAGGPIFGHLAEKFGRRVALLIAMVFSLGGLAVSAQAHVEYMLIIGRVLTGFGHGGQLSSTLVLVQELTPRSMHGRMVSLLDAFAGIGGLIGLVFTYAVAPWLGWRTTYIVMSGCVLYTVVLRFTIPESPRWLASVGHTDEAHNIVKQIERLHYQKKKVDFTSDSRPLSPSRLRPLRFKPLVPTFVLWTLWIVTTLSAYVLGTYIPTLISLTGFNMFATWSSIAVLKVAQVAGSLIAASVMDIYGSHRSLAVFATMASTASVVLGHMTWSQEVVIIVSFLVHAFLSACWSCIFTYTLQHFTTARRSRGMGYVIGVSCLAAVGGCFLYPYLFNVWLLSVAMLCWIFGSVLTVVAVGIIPYYSYYPLKEEKDDVGNSCASADMEFGDVSAPAELAEEGKIDDR